MTQNDYIKVAQNFAGYANKRVEFEKLDLHSEGLKNKYIKKSARLIGVGVMGNAEHFILADLGRRMAVHYSKVKMPKI